MTHNKPTSYNKTDTLTTVERLTVDKTAGGASLPELGIIF